MLQTAKLQKRIQTISILIHFSSFKTVTGILHWTHEYLSGALVIKRIVLSSKIHTSLNIGGEVNLFREN